MSEFSFFATQAVIYSLDETNHRWLARGDENWAEVHILLEPVGNLGNFRLVGWIRETGEVVLNNLLTHDCLWIVIAEDFMQLTDPYGEAIGMCFVNVEAAQKANESIVGTILQLQEEWGHLKYLTDEMHPIPDSEQIEKEEKKLTSNMVMDSDISKLLSGLGLTEYLSVFQDRKQNQILDTNETLQHQEKNTRNVIDLSDFHPPSSISNDLIDTDSESSCDSDETDIEGGREPLRRGSTPLAAAPHRRPSPPSSERSSQSSRGSRKVSLANFDEVNQMTIESLNADGITNDNCKSNFLKATLNSFRLPTQKPLPSSANSEAEVISLPFKTTQEVHVTYNAQCARYEGLPPEWKGLNQQFGIPLAVVPKRAVVGYPERVPAVLQMMKEYLFSKDGLTTEGIFRLAPDKDKCNEIKDQINNGTFNGCDDVNIIANLIKVWFRELPQSLYDVIPEKLIYEVCHMQDDQVSSALEVIEEPNRSLIYWLLDLMAQVVQNEKTNKMSAKNMAIVISPNLFSVETSNPMFALTMSQKIADFTFVLLKARLKNNYGYRSS